MLVLEVEVRSEAPPSTSGVCDLYSGSHRHTLLKWSKMENGSWLFKVLQKGRGQR